MRMRPPTWLPWLGPALAAGAGALAGRFWLEGGFWTVLIAATRMGLVPVVGYQLWKRAHHER